MRLVTPILFENRSRRGALFQGIILRLDPSNRIFRNSIELGSLLQPAFHLHPIGEAVDPMVGRNAMGSCSETVATFGVEVHLG